MTYQEQRLIGTSDERESKDSVLLAYLMMMMMMMMMIVPSMLLMEKFWVKFFDYIWK